MKTVTLKARSDLEVSKRFIKITTKRSRASSLRPGVLLQVKSWLLHVWPKMYCGNRNRRRGTLLYTFVAFSTKAFFRTSTMTKKGYFFKQTSRKVISGKILEKEKRCSLRKKFKIWRKNSGKKVADFRLKTFSAIKVFPCKKKEKKTISSLVRIFCLAKKRKNVRDTKIFFSFSKQRKRRN